MKSSEVFGKLISMNLRYDTGLSLKVDGGGGGRDHLGGREGERDFRKL